MFEALIPRVAAESEQIHGASSRLPSGDHVSEPVERRLAAIMFTDIVGYTALMAESEAKGHRV